MENEKLPSLSKSWDQKWWLVFSDHIEVEAWQYPLPDAEENSYSKGFAFAKLVIRKNGKIVHSTGIEFAMPKIDNGLLMQVYMLSIQPNYGAPEWQSTMLKFCESFESFEKPSYAGWFKSGEGIFD